MLSIFFQIVSMASFPPTRPIATYGLVLDIEVSFVDHPDPVVPGVVWERYSTIVWVDCFTPMGRLPYRFVADYFRLAGRLYGPIPFPCESMRRFAAGV